MPAVETAIRARSTATCGKGPRSKVGGTNPGRCSARSRRPRPSGRSRRSLLRRLPGGPLCTIEQKKSRQVQEPQQRSQRPRHQIDCVLRVGDARVLDRRSSSRNLDLPTAAGQQIENPIGVGSIGERRQRATLDRKREDRSAMAASGLAPHVVHERQRRHEARHRRYEPVGECTIDAAHEAGDLHTPSIGPSRRARRQRPRHRDHEPVAVA